MRGGGESMAFRRTLFSDVCGTMDELRRLLCEEYEHIARDPAGLVNPLLEDALFMLGRMRNRQEEYR